jgi:glycosyltransferase involved in cell wall biosynthesis
MHKTMQETKGVHFHGKVPYQEVIDAFMKADVWLYPNIYLETFCTSALEAQAANCLCVTRNFGSLGEVVGDRGIVIDGDPHSAEFKEQALGSLLQILSCPEAKKALQERAHHWALSQTWQTRALEWIEMFSK